MSKIFDVAEVQAIAEKSGAVITREQAYQIVRSISPDYLEGSIILAIAEMSAINETEPIILKNLERDRSTSEDLVITINLPESLTLEIIQKLFREGYIDYLTAPMRMSQ